MYDVTFERIGRGCKGVTERFTVNDCDDAADELAYAIFGFARRHLSSMSYDVIVDLEEQRGSIENGRFGRFTIQPVNA